MAFKVFTNGSVLQASEVNDNLMRQAVSTFSNAAARTAAITAPSEGMLTYLEDVDRYEHWNSSAWVSPFGMTLVASTSPSAQSVVNVNNCFSSSFQNYRLYFNFTGTAAAEVKFRLRSAGTNSTTGYTVQVLQAIGTGVTGTRDTTSQIWSVAATRTSGNTFGIMDISNPFASAQSSYFSNAQDPSSNAVVDVRSGSHTVTSSYDGISCFVDAGTFTGTLRIYGLRN